MMEPLAISRETPMCKGKMLWDFLPRHRQLIVAGRRVSLCQGQAYWLSNTEWSALKHKKWTQPFTHTRTPIRIKEKGPISLRVLTQHHKAFLEGIARKG